MEERNTINFMRLLSDKSTGSTLSLNSNDYYQTEIFNQLPSIHAQLSHGQLSRDRESTVPLRNLVMCMQGKRDARDRRMRQMSDIGFQEPRRWKQSVNRKREGSYMRGAIAGLLPWQHILHTIEGRFGVGVKAYFVFLRYLIFLNLLHCALVWGFILGPTMIYGRSNDSEPLKFGGNDSVLDFFLGTGYLDRSPVFFGYYTRGSLNFPCLNTPLLYVTGIFTIFILSLIMVVRRTTVGYKHTWMLGKHYSTNVSNKIFYGWDFTIQYPAAATLKHSFIRNDLKLFLYEQTFSMRKAQWTLGRHMRLYLLRFILNLLVLSLLGGAFCLIYFATIISQSNGQTSDPYQFPLVSLLLQYLPPITMTFANLVLPLIFRKISSFEDYSPTIQDNATLVRSIFLKLASLGIYLYFVITTTSQHRENLLGREMYKLCIFNFLITFSTTFLMNYPRKLVQQKYPSSLLGRLSWEQHFLVPLNVLELVYIQTVHWVGVYYCPLLPLIGTVILVVTIYIKKFQVLRCCAAERRMIRASSSSVLFHCMLLLGLLMAAATLVFNLYQLPLSSARGPFGKGENVFNVTGMCVDSLPSLAQSTLRYLASEAFAIPLILAEIIILTSYVSRGRANQKAIERLKNMLVMSSSDKRFLVKQHATLFRHQKTPRPRVHTADIKEDVSPQSQ
ncbi:hypothetical protein PAMA_016040 [Pampus argenteus]